MITERLRRPGRTVALALLALALVSISALGACGARPRSFAEICGGATLPASSGAPDQVTVQFVDPESGAVQVVDGAEALALAQEGGPLARAYVPVMVPLENGFTLTVEMPGGQEVEALPLTQAILERDCDDCEEERLAQCVLDPVPEVDPACCHCWLFLGDPCELPFNAPAAAKCDVIVCWLIGDFFYCSCGIYV